MVREPPWFGVTRGAGQQWEVGPHERLRGAARPGAQRSHHERAAAPVALLLAQPVQRALPRRLARKAPNSESERRLERTPTHDDQSACREPAAAVDQFPSTNPDDERRDSEHHQEHHPHRARSQIKVRIARRGSSRLYDVGMCRNIRPLHNFEPPATQDEVRSAALQYVRKISGCTKPSQVNAEAFERAVDEVAGISMRLLNELVTSAPPKDREVEAAKARQRAAARFTA